MSEGNGLPAGWSMAKVEQLVQHTAPVMYGILQPGPDLDGGVPYIRPTEIDNDVIQVDDLRRTTPEIAKKYKRSTLQANDVVLSIVGTIGKVAIVPSEIAGANITQSSARIRAIHAVIRPRYFAWALRSPILRRQFDKVRLGTAVPRLNIAHVRDLDVPIAPVNEQDRIIECVEELISDLEVGVAALERAQANLKRYRAAVLKAAVEGRRTEKWRTEHPDVEPADKLLARILTERRRRWEQGQLAKFAAAGKTPPKNWQSKYKEPDAPDTTNLPELPSGWCWVSIDQLCFIDVGFAFKSAEFTDAGIRLLRGENLEPGSLRWNECCFWAEDKLAGFEHLLIKEGDIILAMDRPLVSAGLKLARAKAADLPCLLVQRMARFRLMDGASLTFVYFTMQTHSFMTQLLGGQTGTQLPHVSGSGIGECIVPFAPIKEQEIIAEEIERSFSMLDDLEHLHKNSERRAVRLRQSILKRAFEGKLVPQDPTDEPAAAQLERIRTDCNTKAIACNTHKQNPKQAREVKRGKVRLGTK